MQRDDGKKLNGQRLKPSVAGLKDGTTARVNGQGKAELKEWSSPTPLKVDLSPQPVASTLTEIEQSEFCRCEETIRSGWKTFVDVGRALTIIRDQRLYRDRYERFEDYYRNEWQYQKSQIYRLMEAAKLVTVLSPIGENQILPSNESQLRPLLGLDEKQVKAVWQRVREEVNGDPRKITARLVQKQVRAIIPEKREHPLPLRNHSRSASTLGATLDALIILVPKVHQSKAKQLRAEIEKIISEMR